MSLCCFYYRVAVPWRAQLRTDRETAVNLAVQYNVGSYYMSANVSMAGTTASRKLDSCKPCAVQYNVGSYYMSANLSMAGTTAKRKMDSCKPNATQCRQLPVCLQTFPGRAQLRTERWTAVNLMQHNADSYQCVFRPFQGGHNRE